jgi:hypothetical protein
LKSSMTWGSHDGDYEDRCIPRCSAVQTGHRPNVGDSTDLWNVGKLIPVYTALQPRRQPSSIQISVSSIHMKAFNAFQPVNPSGYLFLVSQLHFLTFDFNVLFGSTYSFMPSYVTYINRNVTSQLTSLKYEAYLIINFK